MQSQPTSREDIMGRLDGTVALVTGAARGIGRAIALRYGKEGAMLAMLDLEESSARAAVEEARALGATAEAYAANVAYPEQSAAAVDRVTARFGRIDVLVNNAGVIRVRPLLETTPEDWDYINNVNARGLFFMMQAVARKMMQQAPRVEGGPRGRIINIASIAGRGGRPLFGAYAASKAAAISVTQSAAHALAPHINVNAICPGVVDTPMWQKIDQEWTEIDQRAPGSAWQDRIRGIPLGRPQKPEDLTGMAVFLASPDADYITGQAYNVDGGLVMS
jgi:meso-butanediol dehydrogenase/(S,S)-butanediol dehydrogenase/diacetyl reductase